MNGLCSCLRLTHALYVFILGTINFLCLICSTPCLCQRPLLAPCVYERISSTLCFDFSFLFLCSGIDISGALKHVQGLGQSAMFTILYQEVRRFEALLEVIRKSLEALILGVKGEVIMSKSLEGNVRCFCASENATGMEGITCLTLILHERYYLYYRRLFIIHMSGITEGYCL